jgi:hypothetical protein
MGAWYNTKVYQSAFPRIPQPAERGELAASIGARGEL